MSEENRPRRRGRPSLVWPLVLIVVGVVFLLSNLDVISGDVWSNLFRLWPLILIAIGLEGILRREGIAAPTLFLAVGVVFLLDNYGIISVNTWGTFFRLWPLLLVAFGFDVLIGRRSWWASLIGAVLILALFIGGLWFSGVRLSGGQVVEGVQISQPLEGAEQAQVTLNPGAGSLYLDALADSNALLEGTVGERQGENVRQDFELQGNRAIYRLESQGSFTSVDIGLGGEYGWDLGLNAGIPLDLRVELGAGEAEMDLRDLQVSDLAVDMGVGSANITLPRSGRLSASIDGAIGQTVIIVPAGVGVRVSSDTGLANLSTPDGYQENGDTYTSPDYDQAEARVDLTVSQAIGNLVIREE